MPSSVKFRLEDLPPHLRLQAESQLTRERAAALKSPPKRAPAKHPIRLPKTRTPNGTESRWTKDHPAPWQYEALTFRCPSGKYTPDWILFEPSGTVTCVEVKGAYRFGSQSGATAKFKECVALYPAVRWIWAKWNGNRWECESAGGEAHTPLQSPVRPADTPHVRPRPPAPVRDPVVVRNAGAIRYALNEVRQSAQRLDFILANSGV